MHFLDENTHNSIKISLQFALNGPTNNIPPLVQMTAWRRPGDKPSSEPMMFSVLTPIWLTVPQRVKRVTKIYLCLSKVLVQCFTCVSRNWNYSIILNIVHIIVLACYVYLPRVFAPAFHIKPHCMAIAFVPGKFLFNGYLCNFVYNFYVPIHIIRHRSHGMVYIFKYQAYITKRKYKQYNSYDLKAFKTSIKVTADFAFPWYCETHSSGCIG